MANREKRRNIESLLRVIFGMLAILFLVLDLRCGKTGKGTLFNVMFGALCGQCIALAVLMSAIETRSKGAVVAAGILVVAALGYCGWKGWNIALDSTAEVQTVFLDDCSISKYGGIFFGNICSVSGVDKEGVQRKFYISESDYNRLQNVYRVDDSVIVLYYPHTKHVRSVW